MIDKLKISKSILIKINSQIATRTSAKKISEQLEGKYCLFTSKTPLAFLMSL